MTGRQHLPALSVQALHRLVFHRPIHSAPVEASPTPLPNGQLPQFTKNFPRRWCPLAQNSFKSKMSPSKKQQNCLVMIDERPVSQDMTLWQESIYQICHLLSNHIYTESPLNCVEYLIMSMQKRVWFGLRGRQEPLLYPTRNNSPLYVLFAAAGHSQMEKIRTPVKRQVRIFR